MINRINILVFFTFLLLSFSSCLTTAEFQTAKPMGKGEQETHVSIGGSKMEHVDLGIFGGNDEQLILPNIKFGYNYGITDRWDIGGDIGISPFTMIHTKYLINDIGSDFLVSIGGQTAVNISSIYNLDSIQKIFPYYGLKLLFSIPIKNEDKKSPIESELYFNPGFLSIPKYISENPHIAPTIAFGFKTNYLYQTSRGWLGLGIELSSIISDFYPQTNISVGAILHLK